MFDPLMGRRTVKTHPITGQRIAGNITEVSDVFPRSAPGRGVKHDAKLKQAPNTANFEAWLEYYVVGIGALIQRLNGLQADTDTSTSPLPGPTKTNFETELGRLATLLGVADPNHTLNPQTLFWPLSGRYVFEVSNVAMPRQLTVEFDSDNDFNMVVNCRIMLAEFGTWGRADGAPIVDPPPPISSSSYYVATSSSNQSP